MDHSQISAWKSENIQAKEGERDENFHMYDYKNNLIVLKKNIPYEIDEATE